MGDGFHSRQSFLGEDFPEVAKRTRIAVVGTSGGGSHIVQQLAHLGFQNFRLFDPKRFEEKHLHRFVGATRQDVVDAPRKVDIATRVIRNLWPDAHVEAIPHRWQDAPPLLRTADLIFGCVDGWRERIELETAARRYLIPMIDIGLGISPPEQGPWRMGGQVVLSMPGQPCLRCMRVITDEDLAEEAAHTGAYPNFGPNPQVVWANGVLASTAVGVALDFLTRWNRIRPVWPFLSYGGNEGCVRDRLFDSRKPCEHYPICGAGDPFPV